MLNSALYLFILRERPFSHFNFPRWQAFLAISLIGVLAGLDPALRAPPAGVLAPVPGGALWTAVLVGTFLTWGGFLISCAVLHWWMRRGGRWDGQGDLFNLVAASWLVPDVLGTGLVALGVPSLLTLPLWLFSIWVAANALSGAIPRASLGYCIGGIAIGAVPVFLLHGVMGTVAMLGAATPAGG